MLLAQGDRGVALVMPQIQVGFRPVFGDVDLAVLERVHGPGVHIDIGVQLLKGDAQPPGFQQGADGRGGHALAQGGQHPAGDEDDFGFHKSFIIPSQTQCQGEVRRKAEGKKGANQGADFEADRVEKAQCPKAKLRPRGGMIFRNIAAHPYAGWTLPGSGAGRRRSEQIRRSPFS